MLFRSRVLFFGLAALQTVTASSQKLAHLRYPGDEMNVYDFCFSAAGTIMAYTDGMTIRLCNPHEMKSWHQFPVEHSDRILKIDMSADSSLIASGGRDGRIIIWDRLTGRVVKTLDHNKSMVTALRFDKNGEGIISGSGDGRLVYYDLKEDVIRFDKKINKGIITSVAVSPAVGVIACAGADKVLFLIETSTGEIIFRTEDHRDWVRSAEFSADGTRLITSGDDGSVMTYNTSNIFNVVKIPVKIKMGSQIYSVDIHNDNTSMVLGRYNGMVMVRTVFSKHFLNVRKPVLNARFVPAAGDREVIVVATYGTGLLRIPLSDFKLQSK